MIKLAETLGHNIGLRRRQLHLSQEAIVTQTGHQISQTYLSEIERGTANVCLDKIELL